MKATNGKTAFNLGAPITSSAHSISAYTPNIPKNARFKKESVMGSLLV